MQATNGMKAAAAAANMETKSVSIKSRESS